jgi:hypothetical protein
MPVPPPITKCRKCGHFYWLSDAQVIGEIPWEHSTIKWIVRLLGAGMRVRALSEAEYLEAIAKNAGGAGERDTTLRIYAWWAGNDPSRLPRRSPGDQAATAPQRSPEAIANLERLLELLDMTEPVGRIMKAEALRELGRFDDAIRLLESDFPTDYPTPATQILELAREGDTVVQEIFY